MDRSRLVRLVCIFSATCCQAGSEASCPVGFMPPDCQEPCRSGSFGVSCASVCPATCTGRSCRADTGFCYRCQDGFTGPKCSLKCRTGFFGQDCKIPCPLNCLKSVCDPFTGFCERCLKGYGGVKCERRSVLRNSSLQSEMIDVSDVDKTAKKTSKSIVVYVLVVVTCCLLPVCAVHLCVQCAKRHASRDGQLGPKTSATAHIPVSLSAHSRRPGKHALKYEQMQTIEEESSNQFALDDDIHAGAPLNTAAASVTTLNMHGGLYNRSQRQDDLYNRSQRQDDLYNRSLKQDDLYNRSQRQDDLYNWSQKQDDLYNRSQRQDDLYNRSQRQDDLYNRSQRQDDLYNRSQKQDDLYNRSQRQDDLYNRSQRQDDLYNRSQRQDDLYNRSQRHACELLQATTLDPTMRRYESDSVHNYQQQYLFDNDWDSSFDFSQTAKGIQGFQAGDVYNKSQDMSITTQSNPTINMDSDAVNNVLATDSGSQKLIQGTCLQSQPCLYERRGGVLSMSSSQTAKFASGSRVTGTPVQLSDTDAAGRVSPQRTAAVRSQQGGYINPQITDLTLRSECSSSFPESVPGQGHTHDPGQVHTHDPVHRHTQDPAQGHTQVPALHELEWQQAQAIKHMDNPGGDMVSLDSPSDIGETHPEETAGEAATGPHGEERVLRHPGTIQCQQTHPDNNHVVNTLPEFQKSKMASAAIETRMPLVVEHMYRSKEFAVNLYSKPAARPSEWQVPKTLSLSSLKCPSLNDITQTHKPGTPETHEIASVCNDGRNRTQTDQQQHAHDVSQGERCHVVPADVQQKDSLVGIDKTEASRSTGSAAGLVNFVSGNRQFGTAVCTPVVTTVSTPASAGVSIPASAGVSTPASAGISIPASAGVSTPASAGVSIPASAGVSIPASAGVSTPASAGVSIPASVGVSTPASASVSTPAYGGVTAVLHRCRVRDEDEILIGGCAEDMTCRRVHTLDYTQLTLRHAFDCTTDECNVFQDSPSPDFAAEERNKQTHRVAGGHTDQHSDEQAISSSTESAPSTSNFHVNGSTNNINRLRVLTRQPSSSPTITSSTPTHTVRQTSGVHLGHIEHLKPSVFQDTPGSQTSGLHLGHIEHLKPSVFQDTPGSQTSMPLFSICSSAPMKLWVTYRTNGHEDQKPTRTPRYFSLSSLRNGDDCPAKRREPLEVSLLLTSPPKDSKKKCSKGKDSEECRKHTQNQIYPESSRHGISPQRRSSAVKCDQFRQVVYTKEITPSRHETSQGHLSLGTDSQMVTGKGTRCDTVGSVVDKQEVSRSETSSVTYTFDPVSRALDENPIRLNVVPETRNLESLTPISAIKLSLTQTLDRDILHLHTSHSGAEILHSNPRDYQGNMQEEVAVAVKPLTEYPEKVYSTDKYSLQFGPFQDVRNSSWSKNSDIPLVQEPTHNRSLRLRRPDEPSGTFNVPKSNQLQAGTLPVDGTRNLKHVIASNMLSPTPSDTSRQSTRPDNSAGTEPCHDACKPALTVTSYCPQVWVMESRQHRPVIATADSVYPAVSDDSYVTWLSSSDTRSKGGSLTPSLQQVNTGVGEIVPAQATVPGNRAAAEDRQHSGRPDQNLPPNLHLPYINSDQLSARIDSCANKTKSRRWMRHHLRPEGQEPAVVYPLPSLLEELAIWERTVSAVVTNTEPYLMATEHCDVAHSAIEGPVKKPSDNGSRPSVCDVACSQLCSPDSELRCHVDYSDDIRLKLESEIGFTDHNKGGSDCSITGGRKSVPRLCVGNAGNSPRVSNCCQSKAGNVVSPENRHCCSKDSSEFISVSEEASDVFFDALDNFPVASRPEPNCHSSEDLTTSSRDRKRAVMFVEASTREKSNVNISINKSRDKMSRRECKDNNNIGGERIHDSLTRQKTRQQNIAFRFAVPRSTDPTMDTSQRSVTNIADGNRRPKQTHLKEGTDPAEYVPRDPLGTITQARLSIVKQTDQNTRTLINKCHSGSNNTTSSLVGVQGTDCAHRRAVTSEIDSCPANDQRSVAEDFFSIKD